MFNDYVHAALARERVSDLQAKAQAARRARSARERAGSPKHPRSEAASGDGRNADHAARRIDGADQAGPRYRRADAGGRLRPAERPVPPAAVPGPKKILSAAELRYLTEVDHHDHEAIGALSPAEGRGVGIARYIRDADDPRAAEIAVTIADDWQGRGLGAELLARLCDRARQAGICRFTATVSADNVAMTGLLWKMGAKLAGRSRGTMEYEVALEAVDDYSLDWWFRCVDDSSVLAWP